MPRTLTEYQVATHQLKLALKRQRLTYRDLAKRLSLSESGVKKILTASDGSFQRVAEICDVLGLSMRELLVGDDEAMLELAFTPAQQEGLLRDPRALRLYWALVYERRPLAEAQKASGIPARDLFPALRKLDRLGLLELLPGDRVRVPAVRQVRWVGGGPLVDKLYREWSANFLRAVAKPQSGPGELFLTRYFRASQRTVDELIAALRDLEAEFVRRATREMRTEAPELVHLRWMSAVDQRSYLED
jgi:transcriptional regulator with XRE-family HTH domain